MLRSMSSEQKEKSTKAHSKNFNDLLNPFSVILELIKGSKKRPCETQ